MTLDWSNCTHEHRQRYGYQAWNGKPRWQCKQCKQTWTEGKSWKRDDRLQRIAKLGPLFRSGASNAEAMRATGYSCATVKRYYEMFAEYLAKAA